MKHDPPVKKVVTGSGAPKTDKFTFRMKAKSNTAGYEVADMPMPEGSSRGVKQTPGLLPGEEYEFGELEFTMPGTYVYEIAEVNDHKSGYSYDGSIYTVTYEITQNGGNLEAKRTMGKNGENVNVATFEFTNTYKDPDDGGDDEDDDDSRNSGGSTQQKPQPVVYPTGITPGAPAEAPASSGP
ncbi:MAG: hypothetical protein J6I56_07580, partial [Lachnospiraceae bacterium]|nr:hypothetical protein [Lachnospiraceae bacterium]